jgi:hypothetical protein
VKLAEGNTRLQATERPNTIAASPFLNNSLSIEDAKLFPKINLLKENYLLEIQTECKV